MIPKIKKKSIITISMSKIPGKATPRVYIEIRRPAFFEIARRGLKTLISLNTLTAFKFVVVVKYELIVIEITTKSRTFQ